jgi:hypothetical protein
MPEYRAYLVGNDGHFCGSESLVCADDDEAIEKTKRLVDGHDIELWSGARLVIRLDATDKRGAVSHQVIDGRMVVKNNRLLP